MKLNKPTKEQKDNFLKMLKENENIFKTKRNTILVEKLYRYLFMDLRYHIIDKKTFIYKLNVTTSVSGKIFDLLIKYGVFVIEEEVIKGNEENPDLEDYDLYFTTKGVLPSDIQDKIKIHLIDEKDFLRKF